MEERQKIYLKRLAGESWPWTKDILLQKFRYCNVYREMDRCTVWIREYWRKPYADHENLWFAMCLARQINWPPTLEKIGFPEDWNPRRVLRTLSGLKQEGKKIYSGAYILGGGNPGGISATRYTVMGILNPLWRAVASGKVPPPWNAGRRSVTLQSAFDWVLQFYGFGKFLAYEVVTDLRHTRYLRSAWDIYSWANIGPGAQRGLNRLYERDLRQSHSQEQLLNELYAVWEWVRDSRDTSLLPTLELRDVEHSCCEFDKMERAKERLAEGKIVGLERFVPPRLI